MQLKLQNIGIIKEAEVNINGLTVIAGENDSGKSTIGKTLFSIIKSVSRYKEDLEEDKENNIKRIVESIYFSLRRRVAFQDNINLRQLFSPSYFIEDVLENKFNAIDKRIEFLQNIENKRIFSIIFERLEKLRQIISQSDEKEEVIKRAFKKIFFSEFENEILNKHKQKEEKSVINIKEFENEILNIELSNFSNIDLKIYDEIYFNDSTLIETPLILNYSEMIDKSKSYFEIRNKDDRVSLLGVPNISFHIKDLDLKLKESTYMENENKLSLKISDTISGYMKYISQDKEFVYLKKDGKKYKGLNTATGIKSFGILQMLLNSGFIDERNLLVIDEPEVHLHPKWQLEYAKFICELVKNDISIIITSHSPYMIEALQRYSKKENINYDFYISENGYINKIENSDEKTLSKIFSVLSEPFEEFDKMDSEDLHG